MMSPMHVAIVGVGGAATIAIIPIRIVGNSFTLIWSVFPGKSCRQPMLLVASFRPATLTPPWFRLFFGRLTPVCGVLWRS